MHGKKKLMYKTGESRLFKDLPDTFAAARYHSLAALKDVYKRQFNGCTKLKKVTIGSKVTTIGKQAFNGCKALTSITVNSKAVSYTHLDVYKRQV